MKKKMYIQYKIIDKCIVHILFYQIIKYNSYRINYNTKIYA